MEITDPTVMKKQISLSEIGLVILHAMRFCCYIVVWIVVCIDLLYVYNRTILIRNPCIIFSKKSVNIEGFYRVIKFKK